MTPHDRFFKAFDANDFAGALLAVREGVKGSDMGPNGGNALSCALMGGPIELVERVIASDDFFLSSAPDANRMLPVDYAFAGTRTLNLNAVLAAGADPNRLNGDGLPAMQQALVDLHDSLYQLRDEDAFFQNLAVLILHGADPSTLNAKGQDFAAFAKDQNRLDLIDLPDEIFQARREALDSGEDLLVMILAAAGGESSVASTPAAEPSLSAPFLAACKAGDPVEAFRLAQSGAPLDAVDAKEGSALILAIKSGCLLTAQVLLDFGASASAEFAGPRGAMLPLHVAAAMGSPEICKALVQAGADPDARLAGDLTPAMLALVSERWENLASLIKLGADSQALNSEGKNLEAMAREAGHEDIAHWIGLAVEARQSAPALALPEPPAKPRAPR